MVMSDKRALSMSPQSALKSSSTLKQKKRRARSLSPAYEEPKKHPEAQFYYSNKRLAEILNDVGKRAGLLSEENAHFRQLSYTRAAQFIAEYPLSIFELYIEGGKDALVKLPRIGKSMARTLEELFTTDESKRVNDLRETIPNSVVSLLDVPSIGPVKARRLWLDHGIDSVDALLHVAKNSDLSQYAGFGPKSESRIVRDAVSILANTKETKGSASLRDASIIAEKITSFLKETISISLVNVVGSIRRANPRVNSVDILVAPSVLNKTSIKRIFDAVKICPEIQVVVHSTKNRVTARLKHLPELLMVLHIVDVKEWGTAMVHYTGSVMHNIKLRRFALIQGFHLSQHSLTRDPSATHHNRSYAYSSKRIESSDNFLLSRKYFIKEERDVYAKLGMAWIPPEMREDTGEIKLASQLGKDEKMPVVEECDIVGWMVRDVISTCKYNTKLPAWVPRFSNKRWLVKEEVKDKMTKAELPDNLSISYKKIVVDLEYKLQDRESLGKADFGLAIFLTETITYANMINLDMTEYVLKAISDPRVNVLGAPMAELPVHWITVFEAAAFHNVAFEINSEALDMSSSLAYIGMSLGCHFLLSASSPIEASLALSTAKRAWIPKKYLLNSLPTDELKNFFRTKPRE